MRATALKTTAFCVLLALASNVSASGFQLQEQNVSGLGHAYAGQGAAANDASTVFWNPAGMTYLPDSQIVVSTAAISPSAKFTNNNSVSNPSLAPFGGGNPLSGGDNATEEDALVPNFYYATRLNEKWFFGIGVNAPYGLRTEYDPNWRGRYHATESELVTVNINPSFAFKEGNASIGFGFNIQYADATLANRLDSGGICLGLALNPMTPIGTVANCTTSGVGTVGNSATDSSQKLTGDDISYGINFGIIWEITNGRVGFHYRSQIEHNIAGQVDFTRSTEFNDALNNLGPASSLFSSTPASTTLTLPETISFNYFRKLGSRWEVLADITWTDWSDFDQLVIDFQNPVQPNATLEQNWTDTIRVALGASYLASSKWKIKFGAAYDEAPIRNDEDRTARIPDNDRVWVATGFTYIPSKNFMLDVGYAHLFIKDAGINNASSSSAGNILNGSYDADVDILGVQATWNL